MGSMLSGYLLEILSLPVSVPLSPKINIFLSLIGDNLYTLYKFDNLYRVICTLLYLITGKQRDQGICIYFRKTEHYTKNLTNCNQVRTYNIESQKQVTWVTQSVEPLTLTQVMISGSGIEPPTWASVWGFRGNLFIPLLLPCSCLLSLSCK